MFNPNLLASDKAYFWRAVVSPAALFGCSLCCLSSADITLLESWQATAIKSALRLPRTAHHTALLAALHIPKMQDVLRCAIFSAFRSAFRCETRLRSVLLSSLARTVLNRSVCNTSSTVCHMLALCGGNLPALLRVAGGRVCRDLVKAPRPRCGLTDSLKWLLSQNDANSWDLIRLLVGPDVHAN